MKHIHYLDQEPEKVEIDGAKGASMRHLITEKDGAPNFNMRVLSIERGGQGPNHSHPWEHEFFVLSTGCPALHASDRGHGGDLTHPTNLNTPGWCMGSSNRSRVFLIPDGRRRQWPCLLLSCMF